PMIALSRSVPYHDGCIGEATRELRQVTARLTSLISQRCYLRGLHVAPIFNCASRIKHRRLRRLWPLFCDRCSEPRESGHCPTASPLLCIPLCGVLWPLVSISVCVPVAVERVGP